MWWAVSIVPFPLLWAKTLNKPVVACLHIYNLFQTSLMVRTNINTTHLNRWRACGSSRVNPICPEVVITAALLDFGDFLPLSCPPRWQESSHKKWRWGLGGGTERVKSLPGLGIIYCIQDIIIWFQPEVVMNSLCTELQFHTWTLEGSTEACLCWIRYCRLTFSVELM